MRLSTKSELATFIVGLGLFAAVGAFAWWTLNSGTRASAQQTARPERAVAVSVARAERKDMPYQVDVLGTVQPMVTVGIRSRVDSQVDKIHFADGAFVKAGDLLFTLDARAIDAQIRQAEATLARDKAQLEKAQRDFERISGLADKGTYTGVQRADAATNLEVLKATVAQDDATLQNLRVQRTYYDVAAPASGRVGLAGVRPGSVVRSADAGTPLATVNQMAPIYVAFAIPERYIPELRTAGDNALVQATVQGGITVTDGRVAFIDNTVDPQTGTIMVRATFPNSDERLWPGALASARVTLHIDKDSVIVPAEAVQAGQRGPYVFVVDNNAARVRQVSVARISDGKAVIASGLNGDETVVTDGQLALREGIRVEIKRPAGSPTT